MKKHRIFIVLAVIAVMGISVTSCKQTQPSESTNKTNAVEHYRLLQFSETPFDLENGIHPLTDKEAQNINNYTFTYDDQGRLKEVKYVRGDELLSYGRLGGAARITYTYNDHKQTKHFFDKDNQPIESGGVFSDVYTLNDQGVRTGMAFFDKDGNPIENRNKIHSYTWEILDNGMLKERRFTLAGEETVLNPFCPFYELRFSYDKEGDPTRMVNYRADTIYNCTAENCGDIGVCYFEFKYDDNRNLVDWSVHNTVGQLSNLYWGWAKRLNKVDDNGYVIETAIFDQDDEYLSGNNVPVLKYVYDDHGAVTEIENLNPDRQLMDNPGNGVAITKYEYDAKGNRIKTIRLDKDGNPVENDNA